VSDSDARQTVEHTGMGNRHIGRRDQSQSIQGLAFVDKAAISKRVSRYKVQADDKH
jgi:hypothetical protein